MASVQFLSAIFLCLICLNSLLLCFNLSYSSFLRHSGEIGRQNCLDARSENKSIKVKRCSTCEREKIIFLGAVIKIVDDDDILQCECTIVNDFWAVTTTSCIDLIEEDFNLFHITSGSLKWQTGNKHFIRRIFSHENGLIKESISLIKVHNPFVIYPEQLIILQREWSNINSNSIQLYGWSHYRSLDSDFSMISNEKCRLTYEKFHGNVSLLNTFDDDVFCMNFCQYHIGNPLVDNGFLIGLSSNLNVECADNFLPGKYLKISYYYDWIVNTMNIN
ncbi:unnamed protein product [Brassicogethes aeneus]|uniref:Peptidase S1 domain-containing protein n=1 Tax=Brassicogethes aeneus TaxID=1431903 RepID=A0A9P0BAG8_BRAAE|nr:unnamed protein product [Brassicogethes aeneus]